MGNISSASQRARLSGLLAGLLVAGSLVSGLPAAAADDSTPTPLIELIHVENGTAEPRGALGGGNFTAIIVGNQVFGVVYGTADNHAPVTLFTVVARSLGTATVRDAGNGKIVKDDVTLPFLSIMAERLEAAFEFRDLNGDGMFNFRPNLETSDPFDIAASEFAVKSASLAWEWNMTAFELAAVNDSQVDVTLVLTADNVPYRLGLDVLSGGDGILNKVEFTIHVKITREAVHGAMVPHFEATVDREAGKRTLTSLAPAGTTERDYTSTRAVFKVDHDIVGWDFAAPRLDIASRLFLRTTIVFANAIDPRISPWLNERALAGERGATANVSEEHNNTTVDPTHPLADFRAALGLGLRDGFGRAGGLAWVPTASVWTDVHGQPTEQRVAFQVLGGVGFKGPYRGLNFTGLVLVAGFVYPSGARIYHDPELQAESVEVEGSSVLPTVIPALILFGEAIVVVVAMAGVLAVVARAASGSSKARVAEEARRIQALRDKYQLPQASEPPRRGGD